MYDLVVQPGDGGSNTSCTYDYVSFTITSLGDFKYCGYVQPVLFLYNYKLLV